MFAQIGDLWNIGFFAFFFSTELHYVIAGPGPVAKPSMALERPMCKKQESHQAIFAGMGSPHLRLLKAFC